MRESINYIFFDQLKKYSLSDVFENNKQFDEWYYSLNKKQKNNLCNLNIPVSEVEYLKELIIDTNLLNCTDYQDKIKALSKLKNVDGCYHLLPYICDPYFINSDHFYSDIDKMSKAKDPREALCIVTDKNFINSPYHDEDLDLIVNACDRYKEDGYDLSIKVAGALAEVASNIDSINSPYHRDDMDLISKANPKCLQSKFSFPLHSLNKLAINKESLSDENHLDNMLILNSNPDRTRFLYDIMTNEELIESEDYKYYIASIVNAKNYKKALAIYSYITKLDFYHMASDVDFDRTDVTNDEYYHINKYDFEVDTKIRKECIQLLNTMPDDYVIAIQNLLINKEFMDSINHEFDLDSLLTIANKHQALIEISSDEDMDEMKIIYINDKIKTLNDLFYKLYRFILDEKFMNSPHHVSDMGILSNEEYFTNYNMLVRKASNQNFNNHEYDMKYIATLDIENISEKLLDHIKYFLYDEEGINNADHIKYLTDLKRGFKVDEAEQELKLLNHIEELRGKSIKKTLI